MGAIGIASVTDVSDKQKLFAKLLVAAVVMLGVTAALFLAGFYDMTQEAGV
jgi:hypothetical protein